MFRVEGAASEESVADYVVIGSGIGGLSAAALLARYGYSVRVFESHAVPGGAAHGFQIGGYHFESGPSLYSGLSSHVSSNPLRHVLNAIGHEPEWLSYSDWGVHLPQGSFVSGVGGDALLPALHRFGAPAATAEWRQLQQFMRPLAAAAVAIPPAAIRLDAAALLPLARFLPRILAPLLTSGPAGAASLRLLMRPFSEVMDEAAVGDAFIRKWLDLLCFLLSGLPADATLAVEMAFMFNDFYTPNAKLDYPKGGSPALVRALQRGLEQFGGAVACKSHVEHVLVERGRACGVLVRGKGAVRARRGVISNATLWDTVKLLPAQHVPPHIAHQVSSLPQCRSFVHLHVGFDGAGLASDLPCHHAVVNDWDAAIDAEQNVVLVSIPSLLDPDLAPHGHHVLHAYVPATEPYSLYEGLDRRSEAYAELKAQRCDVLWRAAEKVIPDIRKRAVVHRLGSPVTHERFLRRFRGSYGPAVRAADGLLPQPTALDIPRLWCCGDSVFPGIGLPAVAASGTTLANSLVSVWKHCRLLDAIFT